MADGLWDIAKDDQSLWVGSGNSPDNFVVAEGNGIQIALAAREAGTGTPYDPSENGHFQVPGAADKARFVYSVATADNAKLSDYKIKLTMDFDPSVESSGSKTFILVPYKYDIKDGRPNSGYAWVYDANNDGAIDEKSELPAIGTKKGNYIIDDEGNTGAVDRVTQNIENLGWFDGLIGTDVLKKGLYTVTLSATKDDVVTENSIVLNYEGHPLTPEPKGSNTLLPVAQKDGKLWVGSNNSADGFITSEAKDQGGSTLQLALTARARESGDAYERSTKDHVEHFAVKDAGPLIGFAYSIASDGMSLDNYDIKLKMDMDAGVGTNFKTFILSKNGSKLVWVHDKDNDGQISADEMSVTLQEHNGGHISDDGGNSAHPNWVTQNIETISWFDTTPTEANLAKGTYDLVLEAYDKGNGVTSLNVSPVISTHIAIDVAGGATPPSSGGGGTTPPVTPPPATEPKPYVPPVVADPSPTDGFNEAKAAASVVNFLTGTIPTPEKQAALNEFANVQYEAYKAAGVVNPAIGPYEALGRAFAETVEFSTKYGAVPEADFITARYLEVFGRAPSAIQQAHFQAQIDYFEAIYQAAGISSVQADIFAKGAILGQMLGHAAIEVSIAQTSSSSSVWDLAA